MKTFFVDTVVQSSDYGQPYMLLAKDMEYGIETIRVPEHQVSAALDWHEYPIAGVRTASWAL